MVLGQNLGQIMPNVMKIVKEQAILLGFFSYFTWELPFKARSCGCKTTRVEFMVNIAKNATFK